MYNSCRVYYAALYSVSNWVTAWKAPVFGVIVVRIFLHLDRIRRDTEYSVWMRKNTDHNNSEYGHFLGSEYQISSSSFASKPELIKGFFQTFVMRNIVFAFD